jgi:hypothetical protein
LLPLRFSTKNKIESCPQAGDLPAGPGSGAGRAQASRLRPKKLHQTRESPLRGSRRKVGGTLRLTRTSYYSTQARMGGAG